MKENTITTVECRKLRELIRDITSGHILTHEEAEKALEEMRK